MTNDALTDTEARAVDAAKTDLKSAMPALVALAVSIFVAMTTELLPVGLLPQMGAAFGKSITEVGVLVTIYAGMVAVFSIPLTIWTKRVPRKQLLLTMLITFAISSILVAASPNFTVMAIGRAIGGASHALFFAVALGYPARILRPWDLGKGMAITGAGVSLGHVVGVPLATALGVATNWRWAFGAVAIMAVLLCMVVAKVLPSVPNPIAQVKTVRPPGAVTAFSAVMTVNLLLYLGHYTAYTYINPLLRDAGASESFVAIALLVFGAVGIIGLLAAGSQMDTRPRKALLVTMVAFVAGLVLLYFSGSSLVATVGSAAIWCVAFGSAPAFFTTAAIRTNAVTPDMSAAWINATANVGIAMGAVTGAKIIDASNLQAVSLGAAGIFAVCTIVVFFAKRGFPHADPKTIQTIK